MKNITALPHALLMTLCGIYALLLFSQCLVLLITKLNPSKDFSDLSKRVRSWWVMVIIFTLALVVSKNVSIVFLGFVSFIALKEFFSLIPTRRSDRRVLFWAYLTIPIQYYIASISWYGMFLLFIPLYMFLGIPLRMIIAGETQHFLKAVGTIHWGLMSTVYCLSHATYLLNLPTEINPGSGGAGLLLFLVLLTQLNDVAQYCWGKLFGKHKIVPKISPGKTVEGFVGGVFSTVIISILLSPYLTPFDFQNSVVVGLIISVFGFVGDINISAIKRDMGVKDSGTLIPGHGGVLDRVDSLVYTAPLFFHYIYYFYI